MTKCSLCQKSTSLILSLEPTPPANELLCFAYINKEKFPLNLTICRSCKHMQLDEEVDKNRLFNKYVFTSNTSASNIKYFADVAEQFKRRYNPKFVVDIGCNDCTFLKNFDCKVYGVDPAENILNRVKGIETKCGFFDAHTAIDIEFKRGKADLITCMNVFAHNKNLDPIMLGVKNLLSESGRFIFEVSYGMRVLEKNLFDLIYHEHYHHWILSSAVKYVKKFGLKVVDAEIIPETHGGSLRVIIAHDDNSQYGDSNNVKKILDYENKCLETNITKFKRNVPQFKELFSNLLSNLKSQKKTISILGYPAKACTLSYYLNLDKNIISNVFDDNILKIGKYTQMNHLIRQTSLIQKYKPDYLIILSWNYQEELIKRFSNFHNNGGKFIIPFPDLRVI